MASKEGTVMDRPSALARLAALTTGLSPTAGVSAKDLQTARDALARSLLQHAVDPSTATAALPTAPTRSPTSTERSDLIRVIDRAAATEAVEPVPLVFPRALPALALGNAALVPAAVAGMQSQSLGPFVDELGALHWFDIFPPLQQTAISRVPSTAPFALLPLAVPTGSIPTTLAIGAGTLWLEAQLLAPASPAGGYAGIAISGGTLTCSVAPTSAVGGLQVALATTVTVTVTPAAPSGPVGGGEPGADGGAVVANVPAQLTVVFDQAGAQITAVGAASLTVYGSTVGLKWESAALVYERTLAQLLIPLKPQSPTFIATSVQSDLFEPAGSAAIAGGAWALPVAITAPSQLGAAASAGLLALILDPGLKVGWSGVPGGPATLGRVFLECAAGMLALLGTVRSVNQFAAEISLWKNASSPSAPRSSIDVTFPNGTLFYYTSIASFGGATHVEIVTGNALLAVHIDRPLAADGSRLGPRLPGLFAVYETAALNAVVVVGQVSSAAGLSPPIALALHNALLVSTPPVLLLVAGTFTATPAELDSGGLLLVFGLEVLLPTLPDPYAANFLPVVPTSPRQAAQSVSSPLLGTVVWTPSTSAILRFSDTALGAASLQILSLPATATPAPVGTAGAQDQTRSSALTSLFDSSIGGADPAYFLLDVSSNVDQLGVGLAGGARYIATLEKTSSTFDQVLSISGLDLMARGLDLRVFTAPAVQWEPVVTVQNSKVQPYPFPSPAGFLDDGGPTLLGANDVTLVPVAPAPLLAQVITAYQDGQAAAIRFTLPFGIEAVASLPARPKVGSPLFRRPGLSQVQPSFVTQSMTGGRQLSLTAASSLVRTGAGTPSLPGATIQLRNLVDQNGNPVLAPPPPPGGTPLSVLGPDVDTIFNAEFAPGGSNPLVPLTRIDLSGYGASSFSAWTDPDANPPSVVQARFNVIVGRASREVVQVKSILYPWGAIVVRTITIDRQDNAEISRYDSGWVAATPGTFATPGITVHPGAVLGAYNIREISDTTQTYSAGAVQLTGVYFDADIHIDGVLSGAINGLVPSTGQFGFVQTAPAGSVLTPTDLSSLITGQGALGGPVDCVIDIAGTAQTMRVSRVEVDNAPHAGVAETHEFAAAARGSVVLPSPGNWSVVERTDNVSEPTPIDADLGVPLIQEGPAGSPPSNAPWRLCEPVDLWVPDAPSLDYCLLHATDSTRILFPRPQIASGASAFTSDQVPLLADGFALMGATSVCPRQDACLTFPNANYMLQIGGAGAFTLANVPATFAPSVARRTLATSSAGTIGFEYADANGTQATVSVAISPNNWSVGLQGVNVRLDINPFDGLMRTVGNYAAANGTGVAFQNGQLVLGSILQPLQDLLSFLEELGLPDPLTMSYSNAGSSSSNKYKLKAGLGFELPSPLLPALTPLLNTPVGTVHLLLKTGFGNTTSSSGASGTATTQWTFYFTFSGDVQVPVFALVKAGGLIGFGITIDFPAGTKPQSEQLSFTLGVIITVGGDIIPDVLKVQASVSFAFMLVVTIKTSASIAVGVQLVISAQGQILGGLVGISFTAEADGLVTVTAPRSVQATFEVSMDVQLCWVLSVSFDETFQYTKSLP
jgi:hypothetical protein